MLRSSVGALGAVAVAVAALYPLPGAAQVRSNFALLDSLIAVAVAATLDSARCDTVAVVPLESALRWLVVEKYRAHGVTVGSSAPCTVAIADGAVRYALYTASRDSIERSVRVELRLLDDHGTSRAIAEWHDVLDRTDIALVELPRSELTSAPVPPPPRSFWDDVLEPVIVVASVATTLVLLFTVRSR